MEKRNLNVSFYKAGNGESTRINLPLPWVRELGISKEDKEIELYFDKDNQQLIIRKKK